MTTLTNSEKQVWYQYSKVKGNRYTNRCKINSFSTDCQPKDKNHRPHELAKFNAFYDHTEQGHKVITEAYDSEGNRRDIVCLSCNLVIEIENSTSKRGHRHPKDICVVWYNLGRERTKEETIEDTESGKSNGQP